MHWFIQAKTSYKNRAIYFAVPFIIYRLEFLECMYRTTLLFSSLIFCGREERGPDALMNSAN